MRHWVPLACIEMKTYRENGRRQRVFSVMKMSEANNNGDFAVK